MATWPAKRPAGCDALLERWFMMTETRLAAMADIVVRCERARMRGSEWEVRVDGAE